jgi:hypothetical protein
MYISNRCVLQGSWIFDRDKLIPAPSSHSCRNDSSEWEDRPSRRDLGISFLIVNDFLIRKSSNAD